MLESQTTIVAREFLCHQEGILKAQFCVIDRTSPDSLESSQPKYEPAYKDQGFSLSSLLVHHINNKEINFNETAIMLKKHMGALQAYIADEKGAEFNFILFQDSRSNQENYNEDKIKEFEKLAQRFYSNRFIVETYKENLQLCWDAFGVLKDILKNKESYNIEIVGDFIPSTIEEKIIKDRKGVMMLATKSEHRAQALLYTQNKKDAQSLYESLRKNINLDKSETIYVSQQDNKTSSQVKKESWFLNFSFYDSEYDVKFEVRFPNEHCYKKSLDYIRDNNEVRIVSSYITKSSMSNCLENDFFFSEAREDNTESNRGSYSKLELQSWVLSMEANDEPVPPGEEDSLNQNRSKGRRRFEIKKIIDKLLGSDFDYIVLFPRRSGQYKIDAESVDPVVFKNSFNECFKEFKYIHESSKKYFIQQEYSTPLVTVVTQSQSTLKDILQTLLEHYKGGVAEELIAFNSIAKNRTYYCFAKMGRLRQEEIPYKVVKRFKDIITDYQKKLRIVPCLMKSTSMYKMFTYCCFNEKAGLGTLENLRQLFKPNELRFAFEKSKMTEEIKAQIKAIIKKESTKEEVVIENFREDGLILMVYSKKTDEAALGNFIKTLRKSIDNFLDSLWKKAESAPFNLDDVSQMPIKDKREQMAIGEDEKSFILALDLKDKKESDCHNEMEDSNVGKQGEVKDMESSNIMTEANKSKTRVSHKQEPDKSGLSDINMLSILNGPVPELNHR